MKSGFLMVAVLAGLLATSVSHSEPLYAAGDGAPDPSSSSCKVFDGAQAEMEQLAGLCRFAASYRQSLPNFVCSQQTVRKSGNTKRDDVISATVTYDHGLERYSEIRINGEPTSHGMSQLQGMTSWGEFGNLLVMLFDQPTAAEFRFVRQDVVRGVPVNVFRFHVPRERNAIWMLRDGHRELLPEYRGELTLSRVTSRLMRIDIEALGIDDDFGLGSFHSSTEFDVVPIAGAGEFLLPARSSSEGCLRPSKSRKTSLCMSNRLELSGCHKFGSETKVVSVAPVE